MLQQVMRVSWRGVSSMIKWAEPVTGVRTLDQMPGPSAISEGEEWQKVRSLLAKHMLRPKSVEAYFLCTVRVQDRVFDAVVPMETERFIQSINKMFVMTLLTMAMPAWLHRLFPGPWRTFCQCWDYMFHFAKGHIDKRLKEEEEKLARGQEVEGRYLTYFLSRAGMPMKSVYSNVTELLLAGVDTISSTLSWSLYELSHHPEIQESLRSEVLKVLGDRRIPTAADVANMPLLKAVIKEITRLYPVIPANARVITDRNITVGGYLIPKKTLITLCHYATSRDPAQFSDPDSFLPQRWIRRDEGNHPYSSLPFGVGKRSCIGRRIAELELYLALSRILLHFTVKPDPSGCEVRPMTRTLLVPDREINLQLIER
ncbi:hypothetical protein HF521_008327 [Silurus meridionalis]|uniref:25-hydroxyvitamin D-1 alpha hydroxylase, mitochondrial n=1 Tax=Silurus meridionalis TaxID=175797 RepID=A0A8T0AQ50_SILME|nr:hypothetical protein HF521_008327 [Silurus meridionalis]